MSAKRDRLRKRFANPDYRHGYFNAFLNTTLAAQIKALRERQSSTQAQLAAKIGTVQSGVSTLENVNYSRWSVSTLRKLARAFDVGLIVRFASFGEVLGEIESFGEERIAPPPFSDDPEFGAPPENAEVAQPTTIESRVLTFALDEAPYRRARATGAPGSAPMTSHG
jgi:transcriptional regulator with XRE-family HTH domain